MVKTAWNIFDHLQDTFRSDEFISPFWKFNWVASNTCITMSRSSEKSILNSTGYEWFAATNLVYILSLKISIYKFNSFFIFKKIINIKIVMISICWNDQPNSYIRCYSYFMIIERKCFMHALTAGHITHFIN